MASVYEKYYERQPAAVKIIAVGALAVGGYLLYRSIKKAQDLKDANKAADLAKAELGQLAQQGVTPTFSASQFENMAQTIVSAIDGCGTDEDAIYGVFNQLRNEADVRQLVATFGVRYIRPCAATDPISYSVWLVNDQAFGGPLTYLLHYDLGDDEISTVNSILRQRGINYQF